MTSPRLRIGGNSPVVDFPRSSNGGNWHHIIVLQTAADETERSDSFNVNESADERESSSLQQGDVRECHSHSNSESDRSMNTVAVNFQ